MAQIQQGTAGRFGILKQGAFDSPQAADASFYYTAFTQCDFSPIQGQGTLPAEAGNQKALPRGTFKTGVHAAGGLTVIPRLDNRFGYWLEAICGDASVYTDQNIAQVIASVGATVGCNTHLFGFVDGDDFDLPYLTVHRFLPHDTAADQVGEIIQDVRVARWLLTANAAAVVTSRLEMLGRVSTATVWDIAPGWQQPTLDDDDTFLVTSCTGSVKVSVTGGVPGTITAFDAMTLQMDWTNVLLPPNQTRSVGSPHPKDFPCLSRTIGFNLTIFIDDYDLYVQTFGGAADPVTDTGWSCTPLKGDIDITLLSPALIGATSEYHTLRILTDQGNVDWLSRPIVLVPNRPVMLQLSGTVTPAASGRDIYVYTQNGQAGGY